MNESWEGGRKSFSFFILLKLSANALWDFAPQPQGKPPQCFSFLFHQSDFALLLEKGTVSFGFFTFERR